MFSDLTLKKGHVRFTSQYCRETPNNKKNMDIDNT